MAIVRIRRGRNGALPFLRERPGALVLAGLALLTSCVMPLAAARGPVVTMGGDSVRAAPLMVVLDAPQAFDSPVPQPATAAADGAAPADQAAAAALLDELKPFTPPSTYDPGPAAAPYIFKGRTALDNLRAQLCLTSAIYYEAANEPDEGQRAVAQVVLNRVRHPAWPNTVCDVVYQGTERDGVSCQFTFACDGAMARQPALAQWARARRVAIAALAGYVHRPVGLATHYHTMAVSPSWNKTMVPTGIFGAHIFWRWPGGAGGPAAFHNRYAGGEPVPGPRPKLNPPLPSAAEMSAQLAALGQSLAVPADLPPQPSGSVWAQAQPVGQATVAAPSVAADRRYRPGALPESTIREEWRNSGEWIARK